MRRIDDPSHASGYARTRIDAGGLSTGRADSRGFQSFDQLEERRVVAQGLEILVMVHPKSESLSLRKRLAEKSTARGCSPSSAAIFRAPVGMVAEQIRIRQALQVG